MSELDNMQLCREYGISCIFYDFDGVMTNNKVIVDENGVESVVVHRGDGHAVSQIKLLGISQVIVSTEINTVVEKRAEKLRIPVIHGVDDKKAIIVDYSKKESIDLNRAIFVGNDTNDLGALSVVGIKAAPKDAEAEVLEIADWISKEKGGDGVVRDLYRWIHDVIYKDTVRVK